MRNIADGQDQDIDTVFNELTDLTIKYTNLEGVSSDSNKTLLARDINSRYLTLVILAVQQGHEDVFSIPPEIGDLVRFGILTMDAIPNMISGFAEPVVDMYFDAVVIDEMRETLRRKTQ